MYREIGYDAVFDAQEHYRLLLDAMARPGTINVLPRVPIAPPEGLTGAAALVGFALLNADVSFYVEGPATATRGDAATATRYLVVNTSARPVARTAADFVFAEGGSPAALLTGMKTGTLPYPEEGATLVAGVKALATEAQGLAQQMRDTLALRLQGPGIRGERRLFVSGLNAALLEALRECNMEFPLGIDLVLVDPDYRMVCIPRSSRIRWETISYN